MEHGHFKFSEISQYAVDGSESYIIDLEQSSISTYSNENVLNRLNKDENVESIEYVVGDSIPMAISNLFYRAESTYFL